MSNEVKLPRGRPRKNNALVVIRLPLPVKTELDHRAKLAGLNRSAFLEQILSDYLFS
jgi:hypothetical protein